MSKKTFEGFIELSLEEQNNISAGAGIGAFLGKILSSIGLGGIESTVNNIWTTAQKQQLIDKIKNSNKGEIEFNKDGGLKVKWDNESTQLSSNNTIIF